MQDVAQKILNIIVEQLYLTSDNIEIGLNTNLYYDLGMDSIDFIDIIMSIDDEFDIILRDSETENIVSFGDLLNLVKSKL